MASARLRKTFQYPTESDDEDAVEQGMDEQDQENLISSLSTQDTTTTSLYTKTLLVLPLAPIALYLPRLLALDTILPTVLAMTSLLASAYVLYFLPLPPMKYTATETSMFSNPNSSSATGTGTGEGQRQGGGGGGKMISLQPTSSASMFSAPTTRDVPYVSSELAEILRRYVIAVNGAICVILAVAEAFQGREWSEGMTIGGGYVPALIFAVVLWARKELRVVDLGELEKLRFGAKST